jgi:hypothetical protein
VEKSRAYSPRIMAAAFSPIMMVAGLVLTDTMDGMTDASATRSPSTPFTFSWESTTARSSVPILHRADRMEVAADASGDKFSQFALGLHRRSGHDLLLAPRGRRAGRVELASLLDPEQHTEFLWRE